MKMKKMFYSIITMVFLSLLISCNNSNPTSQSNPFTNGTNERNMIVVVSDLHFGADTLYAECKNNLIYLEKTLLDIKASPNVKEIVIGGDLVDEWFIPASVNPYKGKDQKDFVTRLSIINNGVVSIINDIIKEGVIRVTYVPGNHDLAITNENVDVIFHGINQVRDTSQGVGTYSPIGHPEIAIEHGHRYNFFCAPDPFSNKGTILPPAYFFTRIATEHVITGFDSIPDVLPNVTKYSDTTNVSQILAYSYWGIWKGLVEAFPIRNKFKDTIIITNVPGFTKKYSVNDLVPYQLTPNGLISINLYNGIQDKWKDRQVYNNVNVLNPSKESIDSADSNTWTDNQACVQYFLNKNSDKRIVVFGHTHIAKINESKNWKNEKCIYVNSGTWIDQNSPTTMDFVVITPGDKTVVNLYNINKDKVVQLIQSASL